MEPPLAAAEREIPTAWLQFHRDTLAVKCEGLTDQQHVRDWLASLLPPRHRSAIHY
jgi:hypothetical protein